MLKKHLIEYGTDTRSRNADDDLRKKNGQNKISLFSKLTFSKFAESVTWSCHYFLVVELLQILDSIS